jgi:cobalt-zinc-cadmium efflux system outer membrane protein
MRIGAKTVAICSTLSLCASVAGAQRAPLTLADVLARARARAPEVVSARMALDEVRGRLAGASVRLQANPEVDAGIGRRDGPGTTYADFEIGVGQNFEPGGRRSARIDAAHAAIAQGAATIDEVTRMVVRQAASAFHRVVHGDERIRMLSAASELAASARRIADRRFQAGDIALLDVNLARASLARVRAELEAAEAARAMAMGELRQLLGLGADLAVTGSLGRPAEADLNAALQSAAERPELRLLEAAAQEAEAERRVGESFSKPEYGVGVRYSQEEGDRIVLGSMRVTLPIFSRGQEQRAVAAARAARLRVELDAARARIESDVRAAFEAYGRRLAAVRILEADAVPGLDENERLSDRSFEVGQIGLPELLVIRREILDTRMQYLDALLEAALARTDLDASAGMLR